MLRLRHILPTVAAVFGLLGSAAPAHAGWLTVTNDTKQVIVIQETGGPLNRPIRGKVVKLQPGETYREFHLLSGTKSVTVYDADALTAPLATAKMTWEKDDAAFAVKADGKKVSLTEKKDEKTVKK